MSEADEINRLRKSRDYWVRQAMAFSEHADNMRLALMEQADVVRREDAVFNQVANAHTSGCTSDLTTEQAYRLCKAAPELLAALRDAVEFIRGSNECLGPAVSSSDREWIDHCVALQKSCEEAIAKAEGRAE